MCAVRSATSTSSALFLMLLFVCALTGTWLQAGNGVGALGEASMGGLPEPSASDTSGGITGAGRPHSEQLPAS